MDIKKQEHLLGILLSSDDVFSRCVSILDPIYFDGDLRHAVSFVLDYFGKYNTPPDIPTVESETNVTVKKQQVTTDKVQYACEEIEKYCRESAVAVAIWESSEDMEKGNFGIILERMQDAVAVSLKRDLGWRFFSDDFAKMLERALLEQQTISTGIPAIDKHLAGGFARKQLTIFTANSGSGKSIMLNNLAHNYAVTGHHVALLSLELPVEMMFTRTTAITSGYNVKTLRDNQIQVASTIDDIRKGVEGSLIMDRIKGNACSNDIRSYLTHYELELGYAPDALFVDYLDKMTPNQGAGRMSISEQDKEKTEQLAELVYDWNLISATASQQNREAIGNMTPRQDVIAGGLTKINTVDNVVSIIMTEEMRISGQMFLHFLKTRSSDGVGKHEEVFFDANNLRICDVNSTSNKGIFDIEHRKKEYDWINRTPELIFDEADRPKEKTNSDLINFMEEL